MRICLVILTCISDVEEALVEPDVDRARLQAGLSSMLLEAMGSIQSLPIVNSASVQRRKQKDLEKNQTMRKGRMRDA